MADSVVNLVVSGLLESIIEKMGLPSFKETGLFFGMKEELERLEKTVSAIKAVLWDAEKQQSTNYSVRNWLLNLKDVAYDIEDLLDLISTQELERKVNRASFGQKIMKLSSAYCLAQKLKIIWRRLDDIAEDRRNYNFQEHRHLHIPTAVETDSGRETYSFLQQSHVYGRQEDKEWIVSRILSSSLDDDDQQGFVIPITGIGGMGKTTLAKMVFSDADVAEFFELRLWAYVSKNFVLKNVIGNIIQSATGQAFSHLSMEALLNMLHDILADRNYLLVLDDVWIEGSKQWLELKELLSAGSPKSTIIVTTREERVAHIIGTTGHFKLRDLSEDHCWSIFTKYAFRQHEEKAYPLLVQIGKSITRKCKGVPLAVKTLASLLHNERNVCTWKRIEESELWMIDQRPNDILPALKLSFDHTPNHLRPCFAFLALSAKGELFYRNRLISYWVALGLLQPQEGTEIEDVGVKHFDELLLRSFFEYPCIGLAQNETMQSVKVFGMGRFTVDYKKSIEEKEAIWNHAPLKVLPDGTSQLTAQRIFNGMALRAFSDDKRWLVSAQMHDLMHDLAAYLAEKEIVVVTSKEQEISTRVRHLECKSEYFSGEEFPPGLLNASKARTFRFSYTTAPLSKSFLETILSNFKCLRILELMSCKLEELPDSIGDLKLLRFLDLSSNSNLKKLPNSTCKLVNLQVFRIAACLELEKLPRDVHKLVSLRHLSVTSKFTCLPERGLRGWSSLRALIIVNCPNLTSLTEGIGSLRNLRCFFICSCNKLASLPNSMNNLINLEELMIFEAAELNLAGWKGLHGLWSLKFLLFFTLQKLFHFPDGIASAAASLRALHVSDCKGLTRLPEGLQHCNSLMTLELHSCPNLSALPPGIHALKNIKLLEISECPKLNERCEKEKGLDWHLISHIPNIIIDFCVIQQKEE